MIIYLIRLIVTMFAHFLLTSIFKNLGVDDPSFNSFLTLILYALHRVYKAMEELDV